MNAISSVLTELLTKWYYRLVHSSDKPPPRQLWCLILLYNSSTKIKQLPSKSTTTLTNTTTNTTTATTITTTSTNTIYSYKHLYNCNNDNYNHNYKNHHINKNNNNIKNSRIKSPTTTTTTKSSQIIINVITKRMFVEKIQNSLRPWHTANFAAL